MKKENALGPEAVEEPMEPMPDLAALREAKGIELKGLSNSTKIRVSYLESIERGEFNKLPEPIYTETFIKTYAREIGIEPGAVLSRYRHYLGKKEEPIRPVAEQSKKKRNFPRMHRPSIRTMGWMITLIIIVGFLVSFFSSYMEQRSDVPTSLPEVKSAAQVTDQKPAENPAQASPAPATSGDPANPSNSAANTGAAPVANPASTGPNAGAAAKEATPGAVQTASAKPAPVKTSYRLVIEATETSWLNIVEDDNPPYEILLRPGERIEREASDKFAVDIGNAGGVSVYFQGKSLGSLGRSGQVVHLTLPSDSRN